MKDRAFTRAPHFFKAQSRIGIRNNPSHQIYPNLGVEEGPNAIADEAFLKTFPRFRTSSFDFPLPETVNRDTYVGALASSIGNFSAHINGRLGSGETQIVVGGDHCVTLPSVLAVLARISAGESVGYVQFDSHGDMNLRAESPTDNFHGMYVRPLLSKFDVPEIDVLVKRRLPVQNIVYVGNLDLDPEEGNFFRENRIKNISQLDLRSHGRMAITDFAGFVSSFNHLHVTIDIDAFDSSEAPATGIPAQKGLFFEEVVPLLRIIQNHPSISIDITEVNPRKPGAFQTILLAQKVLRTLISGERSILTTLL